MELGRERIKLIALDIDGTLLTNNLKVSKLNQSVISKALEKEIHVILTTGRPYYSCCQFGKLLQLESYIITASGGEIWTSNKKLVERNTFDPAQFKSLCKIGKELGVKYLMISTKREFTNDELIDDFFSHEWLKIVYHSENKNKLAEVKRKIALYPELEIANSHPNNIEVNPDRVNKAHALDKICKELGITMKNVMAVGDSLNDVEMIKKSGIGVAMGNAQQSVKEVADYITDTNDNDGVAKAIERFVL